MNPTIIILGIILIILIFFLVRYFTNTSSNLTKTANLNTAIAGIKVNNPQATRYAYGIWVYVNTWNSSVTHTIFNRANNINLYLDKNAPTLKCKMNMSDGTVSTMTITDNFPLQKWVCIIISVDNLFVDAYLDGKLTQSMKFLNVTQTNNVYNMVGINQPPDVNTLMNIGNAPSNVGWDAYIAQFQQWSSGPINPQTAWSFYMSGNGTNPLSSVLGNYGINIQLLKDNVQNNTIPIF